MGWLRRHLTASTHVGGCRASEARKTGFASRRKKALHALSTSPDPGTYLWLLHIAMNFSMAREAKLLERQEVEFNGIEWVKLLGQNMRQVMGALLPYLHSRWTPQRTTMKAHNTSSLRCEKGPISLPTACIPCQPLVNSPVDRDVGLGQYGGKPGGGTKRKNTLSGGLVTFLRKCISDQ